MGTIGRVRFSELVDIPELQALMENYSRVIGIPSAVVDDVDGVIIAHSGWQNACALFHRAHPESCRRCHDSDAFLVEKIKGGTAVASHQCANGLIDAAAPIVVDGVHLANLFAGQFLSEAPDLDFFRAQAKKFGFDEVRYLAEISRLPILPKERVDAVLQLYAQLAVMLANGGLNRLKQVRISEQLAALNRELEERVAERTQALVSANDALRQSEENLSITLHSIGDAVIATDTSGRVVRMNPTAERLTGWALGDAVGRPLAEVFRIVNAETGEPAPDPVLLVMARGEIVGLADRTLLLARDGQAYRIADSAAPIHNAKGEIFGVVLVFCDVTEKYRIEESLRRADERFRLTFKAMPDALTLQTKDGRIIDCSDAFCEASGYSRDEVIGRDTLELDLWVSPAQRLLLREKLQCEGRIDDLEFQARRRDGQVRTMRISSRYLSLEPEAILLSVAHDVTERRQAEVDRRKSEEQLRAFYELDLVGLAISSPDNVGMRVNNCLCEMLEYSEEELRATTWEQLTHPDDRAASRAQFDRLRAGEIDGYSLEKRYISRSGKIIPVRLVVRCVRQADGRVEYATAMVEDISERKAAEERIAHLAFTDPLTGLPNRRLLQERLPKALAASARNLRQGALMLIDLDNFKTLNDTHGHAVGDLLLQQVAQRLAHCIREGDTVARVGGDEFVVMLEDLNEDHDQAAMQARLVGEKILTVLNQPYLLDGIAHRSTPSIGINLFSSGAISIEELFSQADLAMYQSKTAGRNTLHFFDPEMQASVSRRAALESELRTGIAQRQFVLHYQPQMVGAGRLTGAEALIRWQHPQRGLVYPLEFISLAEDTGLILPLGHWVLETACAQLAKWAADSSTSQLTMAVNVSAKQLHQPDFVEGVLAVLGATGANPERLKMELTESLLVSDVENTIAKMTELKAHGVSFSLDDFGTGYSSLSYLKRLPLDQLKIDQGFVRDIMSDSDDAAIAKMVIALAGSLGLSVIAEGVEVEAQRNFLADQGCHGYQGYLFSRPLPLDAFEAYAGACLVR